MLSANNQRRGFTLIELMVAITIAGLLLGIVTIGTVNSKKNSRDAQRIKDIQTIATAIENYAADNQGTYPKVTNSSNAVVNSGFPKNIIPFKDAEISKKYFSSSVIPSDPKPYNPAAANEEGGYIYYTHYSVNTTKPLIAPAQGVYYSMVVSLENEISINDTSLSIKLSIDSIAADYQGIYNLPGSLKELNQNRNPYLFNGPSCKYIDPIARPAVCY